MATNRNPSAVKTQTSGTSTTTTFLSGEEEEESATVETTNQSAILRPITAKQLERKRNEKLVRLARMVAGRLGYDYENQLLEYPEYEQNRRSMMYAEEERGIPRWSAGAKAMQTTVPQFPPPTKKKTGEETDVGLTPPQTQTTIAVVRSNAADREAFRRGIGARTSLPLGEHAVPTALFESNAMHVAALVAQYSGIGDLDVHELAEARDPAVYDAFVELIAANIRTAVMSMHPKWHAKKILTDSGLVIQQLLAKFTLLYRDGYGDFRFGTPPPNPVYAPDYDPYEAAIAQWYGGISFY